MSEQPAPILYREEDIAAIYERRLRFTESSWDKASAYDNVITVAGFAAFFALWSGVADDVTPTARTATAALIGTSLLLYVSWTMLVMVTRHSYDRQFAASIGKTQEPIDAINEWDAVERKRIRALVMVQRFWLPVFGTSVITGVTGALLLIGSCLCRALGWPPSVWFIPRDIVRRIPFRAEFTIAHRSCRAAPRISARIGRTFTASRRSWRERPV